MTTDSLKPVALISMPTLSARFPSFQLALLKPTLEREGIPVQTFSLFMYFGTQVGWRINETLSDVYPCMLGEWIWTKAAFGDFTDNDGYFSLAAGDVVVEAALDRLGVRNVLLHRGVYDQAGDRSAWFAWRGLEAAGWAPTAEGGAVTLFQRGLSSAPPPFAEPSRTEPVFCEGWRDGRMNELQAPLWVYGRGPFTFTFTSDEPMRVEVSSVDWPVQYVVEANGEADPRSFTFESDGWHPVVVETSRPGVNLTVDS
jgi:hypothetical protein